ncbi:MAG TPA: S-methyl-5'-thioadenosine phosphorylase [Ktedonobacterales bacterium]
MSERMAKLGIIGGSGLYAMDGLTDVTEVQVDTPFGQPSDTITIGTLQGVSIAFLPRHGRGHRVTPTEVPARANIWALKSLGVERVLSVSAVGSLREDYAPLHLVVPDQIYDRTKLRPNTFFGGGLVAHVSFADPYCPHFSGLVWDAMGGFTDFEKHRGGTYVCIEGPQFSTKAESEVYRKLSCDIIGMTAIPEAKLAREAELCYATIACVTDYDVWHESAEAVTNDMVVANLAKNVGNAKRVIQQLVSTLPPTREGQACPCVNAIAASFATDKSLITPELRKKYDLLVGKYL